MSLLQSLGIDPDKVEPGQTIILVVQDDKSVMVIFEPPIVSVDTRLEIISNGAMTP